MKTLVIEAFPLLRDALLHQLETNEYITSVLGAENTAQAFSLFADWAPDLIWLDGTFPEVRQEAMIKQIQRTVPDTKILLFGSGDSIPEIKNFFKQGIRAYLPKTACPCDISEALSSLAAGNLYVPASLNRTFTSWLTDPMRKKKRGCEITQREKEVLSLIVEEHTTGEIAKKLFISYCTVETHRINLIQKLGVKNTAGLVRVAFEAGLYNRSII
ncbi:MAG: response regulator transcription factor [Lewinellaceae bacterium]|nr:response regulator transcription factor [Lewinellaceae bacterium]